MQINFWGKVRTVQEVDRLGVGNENERRIRGVHGWKEMGGQAQEGEE